jgi:hypothetical protein
MKVFVYFNLHRKLWSIKALEGPQKGLVVGHSTSVLLSNVTPKVSQAGRRRVLEEKRKNVHAGLVGRMVHACPLSVPVDSTQVTYNPYKYTGFVHVGTEQAFTGAPWVLMQDKRCHILENS